MSLRELQQQKVNPNAVKLEEEHEFMCQYCKVRKAKYRLSFKVAASKNCCEQYHGDCPSLKDKVSYIESKYGSDYYKYQDQKRRVWADKTKR